MDRGSPQGDTAPGVAARVRCGVADTFNLTAEPWLPVQRRSGATGWVAPSQINERIDEDPIVGFVWPRPDFNGAAHEFLIGLLATAAAPPDDAGWGEWWCQPPKPEALEERFASVAHAFNLNGPGPRFMQDIDPLDGAKTEQVSALLMDAPGAQTLRNNADLFVKRGGTATLCRAAAAMALYTLNAYAPSGGAGHRTSLRGGGPMTTLVVAEQGQGQTLWGRLWPNVETQEEIDDRATEALRPRDDALVFPWLAATRTSQKNGGKSTAQPDVHPLQAYWGMPRRIRLQFEEAHGRPCSLTNESDPMVVAQYRTKNYGVNYVSESLNHPLSPYYRQREGKERLPVHPKPGGISYRLWPGLVCRTGDGLGDPAQVVRHWRNKHGGDARIMAFGYDMDNMKARAWVEGEMPVWQLNGLEDFVRRATAGAEVVSRLLTNAVKSALHDSPKGDYRFIADVFYRATEPRLHVVLAEAKRQIEASVDADDPPRVACEDWSKALAENARQLFDHYAPADGLEDRDMNRLVKASFFLQLALRGQGKEGRRLFEALDLPPPAKQSEPRNRNAA